MFWQTLLASSIACGVTTIGIVTISYFSRWAKHYSTYFMSFAAGVIISVSFLHLLPKAFAMNKQAPAFILIAFFGLYVIDRFLEMHVCDHKEECAEKMHGIIPIIGIGIHSLIDGLIYVITFKVHIMTGILAAIGMVLHEFPEGVIGFTMLNRMGVSRMKSIFIAFLTAGVSTPFGVIIGYPLIDWIKQKDMGLALAFSAGALIYAGTVHLIPLIQKEKQRYTIITLAVGILTAIGMSLLAS